MLSRFQITIKQLKFKYSKPHFYLNAKHFIIQEKFTYYAKKKKTHAYDNENAKRIDITRECSISPSLRTDQVHHQVQIPSWVSKLIKNPE